MNNFNAIAVIVVSIIVLKLVAIHFYLKTKIDAPISKKTGEETNKTYKDNSDQKA